MRKYFNTKFQGCARARLDSYIISISHRTDARISLYMYIYVPAHPRTRAHARNTLHCPSYDARRVHARAADVVQVNSTPARIYTRADTRQTERAICVM